jgi:hypothetical protein
MKWALCLQENEVQISKTVRAPSLSLRIIALDPENMMKLLVIDHPLHDFYKYVNVVVKATENTKT